MNKSQQSAARVVLVAGGAKGLGACIVRTFAAAGDRIAVVDVETPEQNPAGVDAVFHADLRDLSAVSSCVARVELELGPVDILVNAAGVLEPGSVATMEPASWYRQIDVNLNGMFHTCRALAPLFQARRRGTIVNVGSRLGLVGRANHAAYSASKFGVVGLTQSLALELAPFGVRVNAVCPGPIDNTGMRATAESDNADANRAERTARIPMGRFGRPQEVADLVQYLASERASYITGQAIAICGGLSIS